MVAWLVDCSVSGGEVSLEVGLVLEYCTILFLIVDFRHAEGRTSDLVEFSLVFFIFFACFVYTSEMA